MKLKKENSVKTKIERIINKRQALIITSLVVLALAIGFWDNEFRSLLEDNWRLSMPVVSLMLPQTRCGI